MRILVDNGDYHLSNIGDAAMLQVTLSRLYEHWPAAEISVFTEAPQRLLRLDQRVHPYSPHDRRQWLKKLGVPRLLGRLALVRRALQAMRASDPLRWHRLISCTALRHRSAIERYRQFLESIDLVVVAGCGFLTDAFADHCERVLLNLLLAHAMGKPTAMFGQGIGPLHDPSLVRLARRSLSSLSLLSVREGLSAPEVARSLHTPDDRLLITGDDAIALAYDRRQHASGNALGVNVRVAFYSPLPHAEAHMLRRVLGGAADRHRAPLRPTPINFSAGDNDDDSIRRILAGIDAYQPAACDDTVAAVIDRVAGCRVVVTGSYHAAVFALTQGIPAIGIAPNQYYLSKFLGLQYQFGVGCHVIDLTAADAEPTLVNAIDSCWRDADHLRPQLLESARRQINQSRAAYERLFKIVSGQQQTVAA